MGNPLTHNYLFDSIEKMSCDFCFVQETFISSESLIKAVSHRGPGRSFWSPAICRQGGVATLINISHRISDEVISWKKDSHGRVVSNLIRTNDVDLNLVNIYAPTNPSERKVFFDSLHDFFIPSSATIIGSDFNCYDNAPDKFGGNVSILKDYESLKSIFTLIYLWRKLHPNQRQFTRFNSTSTIASRLDKFLVSKDLPSPETKCDIFPCSFSDHDFVSLVFDFPSSIKRGSGIWNFNNSLLKDKDFRIAIENLIDDHIRFLHAFVCIQDWWEFLKRSVKEEAISFSRKKRRRLHRDEVFLTNKLIRLRQRLVNGGTTVSDSISNTESRLLSVPKKQKEL